MASTRALLHLFPPRKAAVFLVFSVGFCLIALSGVDRSFVSVPLYSLPK